MATSYISEHSAEYFLVPKLKKILERDFEFVVPLYPWISRELSNISITIHKNDLFQVLAMFPRRPKLSENDPYHIYVSFSSHLEDYKRCGEEYGVPVIAGCPVAYNLWELSSEPSIMWFDIGHGDLTNYLNSLDELEVSKSPSILKPNDIINRVENCQIQDFTSFRKFFRETRELQPHSFYGSLYKPVIFFCKKH